MNPSSLHQAHQKIAAMGMFRTQSGTVGINGTEYLELLEPFAGVSRKLNSRTFSDHQHKLWQKVE